MRHQITEQKRKDDASVSFYEWLTEYYGPSAYVTLVNIEQLKTAFTAGYLEGRKDGKIGV